MKYLPILIIQLVVMGVIASCHGVQQPKPAAVSAKPVKDSVHIYSAAMLDSKKDPTCGMPSGSGMEDTLHLKNGKVIGFCSKECKEAYLKDPKQYPITYK